MNSYKFILEMLSGNLFGKFYFPKGYKVCTKFAKFFKW